jgi:alanine racemase
VLIGRQGREEISATELAAWAGTIPWEILTGITARVPRVYRGGQAA